MADDDNSNNDNNDGEEPFLLEVHDPIVYSPWASRFFLSFAMGHAVLCVFQCIHLAAAPDSEREHFRSLYDWGKTLVAAIAVALVWDNAVVGLGESLTPHFRVCESKEEAYQSELHRLQYLSFPRFLAHASLTPLLGITTAILGQEAMGEDIITPYMVNVAAVASVVISLLSVLHLLEHPELVLKRPHSKAPPTAWTNSLVVMTLRETQEEEDLCRRRLAFVCMILPAVIVVIWTIIMGIFMIRHGDGHHERCVEAGQWLLVTAVIELFSNAGPPWTMAMTGNLGEVVFLLGFVRVSYLLG